jgi:hypothetical protein
MNSKLVNLTYAEAKLDPNIPTLKASATCSTRLPDPKNHSSDFEDRPNATAKPSCS